MKKYLAIIALLLMIGTAFAQTPRNYVDVKDNFAASEVSNIPSEGLTIFTDIAVTGLNVEGVPGYISMTSSTGRLFYLYIDDANTLRIASPNQVATTASPNMIDWNNVGERIGGQ